MLNAECGAVYQPRLFFFAIQQSAIANQQLQQSVTEEEDEIDSGALDPTLGDAVSRVAGFGRSLGGRAQESRNVVFQLELGRRLGAELLIQLEERFLVQLLADGDRCAELAGLCRRRDLEDVEVERLAD